jgi:hypothetical protein
MQPDQRFNVLSQGVSEFFSQGLYDTVNYPAAGATTLTFFSIPLGGLAVLTTALGAVPAPGVNVVKTYRDTNMETANFIPDKRYTFSGMSVAFKRVTAAAVYLITDEPDRQFILNNGWWHFRVGDKDVLYVPAIFVPLFNPYVTSTVTAMNIASNGGLVPMYGFGNPLTINPGQVLRVTLEYPGNVPITTTLDIQLLLHASMQRPA